MYSRTFLLPLPALCSIIRTRIKLSDWWVQICYTTLAIFFSEFYVHVYKIYFSKIWIVWLTDYVLLIWTQSCEAAATDPQIGRQSERARAPYHGFLIYNTTHFLICAFVTELAYWLTVVIPHFRQLFSRYIRFLHGILAYKYAMRYFWLLHHKLNWTWHVLRFCFFIFSYRAW